MTKNKENILISILVSLSLLCLIYLGQSDSLVETTSFLPLDKLVMENTPDKFDAGTIDFLSGVKKIVSIAINKS